MTLSGILTVVKGCSTLTSPGTSVTVSAKATNNGTVNNDTFVIQIVISRSDNGEIIKSYSSGNIKIDIGLTSPEHSVSFIMPTSNVNIIYSLQADPLFSYSPCVPNWQCETPLNGYMNDGCGNRKYDVGCAPPPPPPPPPPPCIDSVWTCDANTATETSNCGSTRPTTACSYASYAMKIIVGDIPTDLRYDVNKNDFVDVGDVTLLMNGTPLREYAKSNGTTPMGSEVWFTYTKTRSMITKFEGGGAYRLANGYLAAYSQLILY